MWISDRHARERASTLAVVRMLAGAVMLAAAATLSLAASAGAITIRVPDDAPTIQAAIDSTVAVPDAEGVLDTVLVAPGTYTGAGNRDLDFSRLTSPLPNDIVVIGEGGAAVTIVDVGAGPEDNARGFLFRSNESREAVLQGFTIRNGWMGGAPVAGPRGTGALARRHELSGAGILVRFFTSPTIRDCVIEACYSEYSGGGVETEFGAEPRFERCVIRGNESAFVGGGGSFEIGWEARPELVDCQFTGNRARVAGGGISTELSLDVTGCLVAGNLAPEGGGVRVTGVCAPAFTRSIVWGNCSDGDGNLRIDPDASMSFECSAVDTTAMTVLGTLELLDAVNIDPIFCDPVACGVAPTVDGDYRLAVNSPCLPGASPCGDRIGPLDAGCGPGTPVRSVTWGRLRQWFDARSSASR